MAAASALPDSDPVAVARRFGEQVPHSRDLAMRVVAAEADQVRMRLAPQPWQLADDDAEEICTGVLQAPADSAAGLTVFAAAGGAAPIATQSRGTEGRRPCTLDSDIDYLCSAPAQSTFAGAEILRQGRRASLAQVTCRQDGTGAPIARGRARLLFGSTV